ncbi:hypothetical protein [Kribbella deserti]|uniref:Peptidase inhibitor family I36 n=1 Tax=Kribbella deserti TaxID=1926257 RepID=A0ABV6QP70_9ACTN
MTKRLRTTVLAASIATAALLAVPTSAGAVPAPAGAAPIPAPAGAVPASAGPATAGQAQLAVGVPDTSPAAVSRTYETYVASCSSGYVCAAVPYHEGYFNFKFYAYGTYRLYNWTGYGLISDRQTGTASTRTLNAGGGQLACWNAGGGSGSYDWTPVEYIRLSQSRC